MKVLVASLTLCFPVVLVLSWAFEITPEGVKWTGDVAPNKSITHRTGRKIVGLTAVVAALAAALFAFQLLRPGPNRIAKVTKSVAPAPPVTEKSIAVLPFENLSEEKANAFFADGVQDEILTDLAKIADLKVISRTSVMQYKEEAAKQNVREIGRELGVAHVLEGSVQRAAGRIRVTAQLIDARTDVHQWAELRPQPG
jgi:TolB-like protein